MVDYQVHDDADAPLMGFCKQFVEVLHGAEFLHNLLVAGDVIAIVIVGGAEHRGKPQGVDPQLFQVVHLLQNARQVTDSVAVGIIKAAGVNLVNH